MISTKAPTGDALERYAVRGDRLEASPEPRRPRSAPGGSARSGEDRRADAPLDGFDIRILEELQSDASRSIAEIGEAVHLSHNACWRRIKRLEDDGYIVGRVVLVSADRVGLGMTVFVTLRVAEHSEDYLAQLSRTISAIPEVVEFYRTSGELDYLIKLLVGGISDYDRIYRKLIRSVKVRNVSASFAMEAIKCTTAVPVRFAR